MRFALLIILNTVQLSVWTSCEGKIARGEWPSRSKQIDFYFIGLHGGLNHNGLWKSDAPLVQLVLLCSPGFQTPLIRNLWCCFPFGMVGTRGRLCYVRNAMGLIWFHSWQILSILKSGYVWLPYPLMSLRAISCHLVPSRAIPNSKTSCGR